MSDIKELLQRKAKLVADARAVVDAAEKRGGGMTAEDRTKYDAIFADINKIKDDIKDAEKVEELRKLEAEIGAPLSTGAPKPEAEKEKRLFKWDTDEYRKNFINYIRTGESRALQADLDIYGGYTVVPESMSSMLIQALDNFVWMRRLATVEPLVSADSLGVVSLDNDPADPTWVSEITTGSEDSTMSFGKRSLTPHPLAQLIKVSKTLIRKSTKPIEQIVAARLAYKFATVEENAFLNGSGSNQPLGIFTASNDGITTAQDVSTGNTTTSITYDGLKNCKYNLAAQYRNSPSNAWIFHRDAVSQIAQLKDGNQRYLWQDSVVLGEPDRLLGSPVYESEYAPNTFTTGLYVGAYGDFSYYWIADALNMTIQGLFELYAATNQNGYIARKETDGMPVLAAAFRRVKLA